MTQQDFIDRFEYQDGKLFYKKSEGCMKQGSEVGTVDKGGYLKTLIKRKPYRLHRIIFMMHHGYLPEFIDHIDGNTLNNRIENLREATHSQNQHNRKINKNNSTGVKGVTWYGNRNSFKARCCVNGKSHHVGYFKKLEDAEKAIKSFRIEHHNDFANHVAI